MIKKITYIDNFAVFNDFDWNSNVRDNGNNISEFRDINVIYGRNYSGKTTLSRIIKSYEDGSINQKYEDAIFNINLSNGEDIDCNMLENHSLNIRVYNEDFVKEKLRWLINEEGDIEPFAIIGEENVEIEEKLKSKNNILGSKENKKGLQYDLHIAEDDYYKKKKERENNEAELDDKLRNKARDIKKNTIFKEVTYNITKIKSDIEYLLNNPLDYSDDKIIELRKLLKEQKKKNLSTIDIVEPNYIVLLKKANSLLTKEINPTETIEALLNDPSLQEWVRKGISHHKNKRNECAFCGNEIPENLWDKLNAHFNKDSEELRKNLKNFLLELDNEKENISKIINLDENNFYTVYEDDFKNLMKEWNETKSNYLEDIKELKNEVEKRRKNIFKERKINEKNLHNVSNELLDIQRRLNELIEKNNSKTSELESEQKNARDSLRYIEISKFIKSIEYEKEKNKIDKLLNEEDSYKEKKKSLERKIKDIKKEIYKLKNQLSDESNAAEKVNQYLNHFLTDNKIRIEATESGSKFSVKRGSEEAFNLSEGECSLLSFCYFMARLDDVEIENEDLIIWIDDPISSLDSNHVFFIYSLIESVITRNKNYKQLFISTHNLEFLKYLKRLTGPKKIKNYFILERNKDDSFIQVMPKYLRKYITEFNYLFHQIYKCSLINENSTCEVNHDCFYNFGNNLRKFLEAYLYYKYPNNESTIKKLKKFFDEDETAVALTNRFYNEFSHLEEIFDRSIKPIDIPEIPKLAEYVLEKIKEKDSEQYEALLTSIGVD